MFGTLKFYLIVIALVAIFLFFPFSTVRKMKKLFAERYNGWKNCLKDEESQQS